MRFALVAVLVCVLSCRATQAQGTLYLSNVGEPSSGSVSVGSNSWIAAVFVPQSSVILNSIQLLARPGTGMPGGFSVAIYGDAPSNPRYPVVNLGSLSGPDPATGGVFTYDTAGINLQAGNDYFIVATSLTPLQQGAYQWNIAGTDNYVSSDHWGFAFDFYYSSIDGSTWQGPIHPQFPLQFAIYGTPIPEPVISKLSAASFIVLRLWQTQRFRKRRIPISRR